MACSTRRAFLGIGLAAAWTAASIAVTVVTWGSPLPRTWWTAAMMLVLWLGLPLAVLSLGTWNLVRRTAKKGTDEDRTPR